MTTGTKYNSVGNKGNQWVKVTIPLDQYVGQTVSFIFVAWRNTDFPGNGLADIAIDDIEVNKNKLTFNYEFLLRFHKNGYKSMVIPKIGYKHVNMRNGSLFWLYKNSEAVEYKIEPKEALFWMESAKKEYMFNEDRHIIYEENEVGE